MPAGSSRSGRPYLEERRGFSKLPAPPAGLQEWGRPIIARFRPCGARYVPPAGVSILRLDSQSIRGIPQGWALPACQECEDRRLNHDLSTPPSANRTCPGPLGPLEPVLLEAAGLESAPMTSSETKVTLSA